MKYSKKLIGDIWAYYMEIKSDEFLEAFNGFFYPSIGIKMGGGDIESTKEEFEQAFMTVSNRFRLAVFKDDSTTVTETRDGRFTEIKIEEKQ